jgi:DNA-binding transcriptional LysR family regulator
MQWDKLRIFYYVVKFESFTKTGEYLNVSQSAISRQITDLEYQIGHKLFKRLPRKLALTRQGELLFQNTEKMFMYSELALTQIQNEKTFPQGDLSVGANVGLVDTWLYLLIPEFLARYPEINLSIFSKDGPLDVEALEVHVALQPYIPDQPTLVQNPLTSWHRRLYASKKYLERYGVPQTVEDLECHRLIGFGSEKIHLFENINWHLTLRGDGRKIQKPYISANSLRALFHLAINDFGIISFSQESPLLNGSGLIEVLPEIPGPNIDICFTYPVQLKGIKTIHVLEEYLQAYVKENHRKYVSPGYTEQLEKRSSCLKAVC